MNKKIKLGTTRVVEVKKDMDIEVTIKIAGRGPKAIKLQQTIVHRLASIPDSKGIKEVEDVFIRNADVIEETESYLIVKHVNFPLSHRVIEEVKEETISQVIEEPKPEIPEVEPIEEQTSAAKGTSSTLTEKTICSKTVKAKPGLSEYDKEQNALQAWVKYQRHRATIDLTDSKYCVVGKNNGFIYKTFSTLSEARAWRKRYKVFIHLQEGEKPGIALHS